MVNYFKSNTGERTVITWKELQDLFADIQRISEKIEQVNTEMIEIIKLIERRKT